MANTRSSKRGFAAMSQREREEISRKGGRASRSGGRSSSSRGRSRRSSANR